MPDQPQPASIHITRRRNLLLLLREFSEEQLSKGVPAKGIEGLFAALIQVSASTLSQLKSSRNMGDKMAAQIEMSAGKSAGWMDVENAAVISTPGETAFVEIARLAWRATDSKGRRTLMILAKAGFQPRTVVTPGALET